MAKSRGKYFIAFDSETGGLDPQKADILTAYFCVLDESFNLVDEIDLKLKPDGGVPPVTEEGAMRVNGIDLASHMADPTTVTYPEAKAQIVTFLKKYHKKTGRYNNLIPLGQNVQFDIDWIQHHILGKEGWDSLFHYTKMDTKFISDFFKLCSWFPKEIGGLESMVDYLGLQRRAAHNAKEDTLMCVDVFKKMIQIMQDKKENSSQMSENLLELIES